MISKKTRFGIICPSQIALRRFLPALVKDTNSVFVGIAHASLDEWVNSNESIINQEREKAQEFVENFGGKIFESYTSLINSDEIDAVYFPLPPSLHYKWAKLALIAGKHVLLEKPGTTSLKHTNELIDLANTKNLAVHENYMFLFHNQISFIKDLIERKKIGDIRLIRLSFGFPRRANNDFRYNKDLGGGALFDCGGYNIKYASYFLGDTAKITFAVSNYIEEFEVDIYGSAVLTNDFGETVQIAFGMDNSYKCDIEVWGSRGSLISKRIFTAPEGFIPTLTTTVDNQVEEIEMPEDDTFLKSIQFFNKCKTNKQTRLNSYKEIKLQASLIEDFQKFNT